MKILDVVVSATVTLTVFVLAVLGVTVTEALAVTVIEITSAAGLWLQLCASIGLKNRGNCYKNLQLCAKEL